MSDGREKDGVFAFVALKPCGCVGYAATERGLASAMKDKWFREKMNAGEVKTILSRDEWDKLPWGCEKCRRNKTKKGTNQ